MLLSFLPTSSNMQLRSGALLAVMCCSMVVAASAQPFTFEGKFDPSVTEAKQRDQIDFEGFIFDFSNAKKTDGGTPLSSLKSNQVSQNPFVSTLPGDGAGQTLVTLGPCSGSAPHTHPRGTEISYVVSGNVQFGIVEENQAKVNNLPVIRNMTSGQTIHIPQGLQHFSYNDNCEGAQIIANFGTSDPGTQTVYNSFIKIPNDILHMSTGIPSSQWAKLKKLPLLVAPSTGGEECLKRCGLNFKESNKFEEATGNGSNDVKPYQFVGFNDGSSKSGKKD